MKSSFKVLQYSFILIIISITLIQGQTYPCSCSCCLGLNCQVVSFPNVNAYYCSSGSCLQACGTQYPQCRQSSPYGVASAQCLTNTGGPYSCQCNCCNTGYNNCTTALIGYTTAYSCDTGSCSISCNMIYPSMCVSNQNGQTQGICVGLTTSTVSTSLSTLYLGNPCSCYCCLGIGCLPLSNIVNTSALQCSTYACTQACQVTYPSICPSSSLLGQTNGLCSNPTSGNIQCQCNCCGSNGCFNYNINTNGACISCSTLCQQRTQCLNIYSATYTCINSSTAVKQFSSFNWNLLLLLLFNLFRQ